MINRPFGWTRLRFKASKASSVETACTKPAETSAKAGSLYPPGPTTLSVVAACFARQRDPLHFLRQVAGKYGDIVHMQTGRRHDYLLNHPDYIKTVLGAPESQMARSAPPYLKRLLGRGLLTSQGEYHRRNKRMLSPAFQKQQHVREWGAVVTDQTAGMLGGWRDSAQIDIEREMIQLTLGITIQALLGTTARARQVTEVWTKVIQLIHCRTLPFIGDLVDKLSIGRIRRFNRARRQLDLFAYALINEARAASIPGKGLLSILLRASDENDSCARLTNQEVRDEILTMLSAGFETTAHALTWTWYILSQHPHEEQKFHTELDTVLRGRLPDVADLESLPYTRMILSESMRLYPPVWLIARRNPNTFTVAGYSMPPGSHIFMSQYLMHRDPRFFADPERFDPGRWTPEAVAKRPKYSYFPFGGGPRQCIGEGLAWIIGVLALAVIGQRWQLTLSPGHKVELEPLISLRPKYGMRMLPKQRISPG